MNIKKIVILDDYNRRIKADQSVIGTVMPNFGNDAPGNGTKIIEVMGEVQDDMLKYIIEDFYKSRKPRTYKEYSPTLRSDRMGLKVKEITSGCIQAGSLSGGKWDKMYEQSCRYYDVSGCCPTISTTSGGQHEPKIEEGVNRDLNENTYRIRKLTPKECWRLMGFDDTDFTKAQQVNSNSQLYKQAGNSIVVNVLEEIFKKLLVEKTA